MSIEHLQPMSVIERASNALSKAEVELRIKELVKESADIVAVTDPESREACHARLMVLRDMRVETQKAGKAGREEATQYSRAVIAIEKELVALIEPEETRLATLRDGWDAKLAAEKQARIDAEIKRVADIRERIEELRGCQTLTPASGSPLISDHIHDIGKISVDASFEEFEEEAGKVKLATLDRFEALLTAAVEHEAAQRKLEADRAELAKLQAEQAERDRIAAEERARQEAADRALRDAEAKRLADERRENERIAEEQRKANAAEAQRLADQRAEIERQQAVLLEAAKLKPEAAPVPTRNLSAPSRAYTPSRQDIIRLVAEKYEVHADLARYWLSAINWKETEAA